MAKSPAPKRGRSDPDLKVVVDDGEVMVHSLILALASPVFDKMLSSNMQEGSTDEIQLPGKAEIEFTEFYRSLQLHTMEPLTKDRAIFLSRWADEYQIEALKSKCEDFLISSVPVDSSSLKHAVTFSLGRRAKQCIETMKFDVVKYLNELESIAEEGTKEYMEIVWPFLCEAARVPKSTMPATDQVRAMWPFLASAVRSANSAAAYEKLRPAMRFWTTQLYVALPQTGKADEKARSFLEARLRQHNIPFDPLMNAN